MSTTPTPQFSTAEYQTQPATDTCKLCGQPLSIGYYQTSDGKCCEACASKVFPRAVLFGLLGAAIGLALYAAFVIITNIEIGYVSLAVGFIVAKAILIGSKGIGGRRYQVLATVLTYLAVSLSFIPIVLSFAHRSISEFSFAKLLVVGLISPFLELQSDPGRGLIGLVILLVGIRIAWRMTASKGHGEPTGLSNAQGPTTLNLK